MDDLLIYSLGVFFFYHLVAHSDLLKSPREWAIRVLPSWMTYPLSCPFCATWWITVFLCIISLQFLPVFLLCAPVINYVIGLTTDALKLYLQPPRVTQSEGPSTASLIIDRAVSTMRQSIIDSIKAGGNRTDQPLHDS